MTQKVIRPKERSFVIRDQIDIAVVKLHPCPPSVTDASTGSSKATSSLTLLGFLALLLIAAAKGITCRFTFSIVIVGSLIVGSLEGSNL